MQMHVDLFYSRRLGGQAGVQGASRGFLSGICGLRADR
jgi:hypothetical protein